TTFQISEVLRILTERGRKIVQKKKKVCAKIEKNCPPPQKKKKKKTADALMKAKEQESVYANH
ncbi:hypothetical protein IscW_ISCW002497, partial [Ixodes scapularis]